MKSLEITEREADALHLALSEAIRCAHDDACRWDAPGFKEEAIDEARDREELQAKLERLFPTLRRHA